MISTEYPATNAAGELKVADFVAFISDRATEQLLKQFVLEQVMPHSLIVIGGVDDAIVHLQKAVRSPLLLLVDLSSSVMPLSDLARLSEVCEPSVQVVAIGERNDVGLFRSLLKLGVRDYLVKPLTIELLKRTISTATGEVSSVVHTRAGKTIAFMGTRGGVGVTTIASHLARHLADVTVRRIAYVDLNLYGGAVNSFLGLQTNQGLVDVLQNVHRLDPMYVERTLVSTGPRLFVLSAELDYGVPITFDPGALGHVLSLLRSNFHYVFLDIAGYAGALVEEALDGATRAYAVADRSVHSVHQTTRLMRYMENRDNSPQASLLLNNPNAAVAGGVDVADFAGAVGRPILHEVPFDGKSVLSAENLGESVGINTASGFGQVIVRIADDLTGQRERAVAPTGFFERFRLARKS